MSSFLRRTFYIIVGIILILAVICLGTATGESAIAFSTVLKTLGNHLFHSAYEIDRIDAGLIWQYRLPRTIVAACCGASLALCGVILQSLLRNPLADPYLLGISAGASTGAVCISLLGLGAYLDRFASMALSHVRPFLPGITPDTVLQLPPGLFSLPVGAFIGALLAFLFVILLASRAGRSSTAIILAGVASSQLFNALTAFIITKWADAEAARSIMFWLLGNLSGIRWPAALIAVPPTIIGFFICLWHARALDAFTFGAQSAATLGISVQRVFTILMLLCALLTAIMVSLVGAVGFVGLVIPHAARFLVGVRHGALIPASALTGAVFLVISDMISRTIVSGQALPIGVITALVGAPAFALILTRRRINQ